MVTGHFWEDAHVPGSRKQDWADPGLCRLRGKKLQIASSGQEIVKTDQKSPLSWMLGLGYLPGSHAPETELQVDSDKAGVHASQGSILITMQMEE